MMTGGCDRVVFRLDGRLGLPDLVQRGARNRLECAALMVSLDKRWRSTDVRRRKKDLAIVAEQRSEFGLADMGGIRQNRLEHRLQIAGRGADDAQHLRR